MKQGQLFKFHFKASLLNYL